MKRLLQSLVLSCFTLPVLSAQAADYTLTSQTQEATAYQGLALVKRQLVLTVEQAGTHHFRITGLPLRLNPDSLNLQAYGSADAVLQHFQRVTPQPFEKPVPDKAEAQLIDQLKALEKQMDALTTREELNEIQQAFLKLFMQRLQAQPKNPAAEELSVRMWEDALQFTLKNQRDLLSSQDSVEQLKKPLQQEIQRLRQHLAYHRQHHPETQSVHVQMHFAKPGRVRLELSYLIPGVQWTPVYEAQLKGETLHLRYGGEIYQQSGETWDTVQLKLSTATPQLNQVVPQPHSWQVHAYDPRAVNNPPSPASRKLMSNVMPAPMVEDAMSEAEPVAEVPAQISDHGIALDFTLPGQQTLASSHVPRQVTLATRDIKASTTYKIIPRQSPLAFLEVNMTNSSGLPLLPGKMRTYVEDSFTGVQALDLIRPSQEARLDFGVDRNIQVKWTEVERRDGRAGVLTDKKELIVVYQAEVTNYKKEPVALRILEPRPESPHPEVKVEWVQGEPAPSQVTDEKLRIWNLQARPWEKKTVRMTYRITYPQDFTLSF